MEDNPFAKIVQIMRNEAKGQIPVSYRLGTVLSSDPLKINISGVILSGSDLLVNDSLIEHEESIFMSEMAGEISGSSTFLVSSGNITAKAKFKHVLNPGDTVFLVPIEDQQKHVVMCKVVSV